MVVSGMLLRIRRGVVAEKMMWIITIPMATRRETRGRWLLASPLITARARSSWLRMSEIDNLAG
jgi:hypothetical protein